MQLELFIKHHPNEVVFQLVWLDFQQVDHCVDQAFDAAGAPYQAPSQRGLAWSIPSRASNFFLGVTFPRTTFPGPYRPPNHGCNEVEGYHLRVGVAVGHA